jgi:hypothetical protein
VGIETPETMHSSSEKRRQTSRQVAEIGARRATVPKPWRAIATVRGVKARAKANNGLEASREENFQEEDGAAGAHAAATEG